MEFDSVIAANADPAEYSNYDNRPIRPMDQDALNEALSRLPILVDDEDLISHLDPSFSLRTRRQPALAYSTKRKINLSMNNQSGLNLTASHETPLNSKRKPHTGTTPISSSLPSSIRKRSVKRIGFHKELFNLKEEKQSFEEDKNNSPTDLIRMKKLHQSQLETIKDEQQQAINKLVAEHQTESQSLRDIIEDQKIKIEQTTMELDNLRDDFALLILEKETLNKMIDEYKDLQEREKQKIHEHELTIRKLKEEISQIKENQQPKREISRVNLNNNRTVLKETTGLSSLKNDEENKTLITFDRLKTNNSNLTSSVKDQNRPKLNTKSGVIRGTNKDDLLKTPTLTINTNLIKSSPMTLKSTSAKLKLKPPTNNEPEGKTIGFVERPRSVFAPRTKTPAAPIK